MERKTFLKKTVGALILVGPALALLNCSSSDDSSSSNNPDQQVNCLQNGASATSISSNHGHSLVVSREDVNAGSEKEYSIQGGSGHSHLITVTAANFNTLSTNQSITVQSSTDDNHTHSVTISCA